MTPIKLYEVTERIVPVSPGAGFVSTYEYERDQFDLLSDGHQAALVYDVVRHDIPVDTVVRRLHRDEFDPQYHREFVAIHPSVLEVIDVVREARILELENQVKTHNGDVQRLRETLSNTKARTLARFQELPWHKRILLALAPAKYIHSIAE
jgi:hypothetical protein